jgi:NAD+ synthase (glutamine-hydrolysing)
MSMRIALAQVDTCVGDVLGNAERILDAAVSAASAGAQLVAFPEMTVTGYPIEDLALRDSFARGAQRALEHIIDGLALRGLDDVAVVLGTLGRNAQGRPTNQAVVVHRGEVVGRYDKHHLPNYGVFDEYRIFTPGTDGCVVEVDGRRVAVAICEDIWVDGGPLSAVGHADLLVVLNGSPYEEGKGHVRAELAARRAVEIGAPVAYVNMVGSQDDLVFDGGSFVVDVDGTVVARAPQFVEHLMVCDLPDAGQAAEPGLVAEPMHPDAEVYSALVTGLHGYTTKNGFRSVVLGLSGGIDSALVAAIAADAIGGQNVVGVSMPSRHSSEHSKDDACDLARRIGADYRVQPIGPIVDAFESQLDLPGIAGENLQARVRGVILMGISNTEGHLVLATGNKSELAVGYSTIYGDAVGGFAPLKDVDKSRVWALARWRNRAATDAGETPPIPRSSITKPPSAELAPDQLDTDSLPPYHLLDEVLDAYVEHAEGRDELLARGFDAAVVDRVLSLVDRAEWKRRQYPPGPKVTALAFGRDRRLPVTNRWTEPKGGPA